MILSGTDKGSSIRTKIISAVVKDPEIIFAVKEKYVDDALLMFCIEREPSVFKKMKHPSEEVCQFACRVDGANLRVIRNKFSYITITDVLAYISVESNPKAILYVPDKLLTDPLMEMAFDADPSLMAYFDRIRSSYLEKRLRETPSAIQYIRDPDEDLVCELIKQQPSVCTYIKKLSTKMMTTLEQSHPSYFQLYRNNLYSQMKLSEG